jgi:Fic family protein
MMTDPDIVRHSQAENVELITDPLRLAQQEARNALLQWERVEELILAGLYGDRPFRLRPSLLLDLNRRAIEGINAYAGNFRPGGVKIGKSAHEPPAAYLVPSLVDDMCEYVNDNWQTQTAVHLAAYVLWRVNWVHPFADGNGRTARAASYVVLCVHSRLHLPGTNTIPEQIVEARREYYDALEVADKSYELDCSKNPVVDLETLLKRMLASQLVSSYSSASGEHLRDDKET